MHFLRSDVANGRIGGIDTSAAEAMPGVLRVFTGADFAEVGGMPPGWLVTSRDGNPMSEPRHPILAHGKVRHVGDPVAAVVAETLAQARDAAEAIELDIEALPAVTDMLPSASRLPGIHAVLTYRPAGRVRPRHAGSVSAVPKSCTPSSLWTS